MRHRGTCFTYLQSSGVFVNCRPGEDPALVDLELQKRLYDNLVMGRKRLDEVSYPYMIFSSVM